MPKSGPAATNVTQAAAGPLPETEAEVHEFQHAAAANHQSDRGPQSNTLQTGTTALASDSEANLPPPGLNMPGPEGGPGSLAFFCVTCPQPGINLPDNWKSDSNQYVDHRTSH